MKTWEALAVGAGVGAVAVCMWPRVYSWVAAAAAGAGVGAVEFDNASTELRVIRKAETVLQKRTNRIILVLERPTDPRNKQAVLRTVECFGIQHVWTVLPPEEKVESSRNKLKEGEASSIGRSSLPWLTQREFCTTSECIEALRAEGVAIWATDLSQAAVPLGGAALGAVPPRVAIVMGREADGVSPEMLEAADKRVYLPLWGFTESLNLSVATALVVQRVMLLMGPKRGQLPAEEMAGLRREWYRLLAKTDAHWAAYEPRINDPPPPFGDVRCPEEHRVPYVRPSVRKRQEAKEAQLKLQVVR